MVLVVHGVDSGLTSKDCSGSESVTDKCVIVCHPEGLKSLDL